MTEQGRRPDQSSFAATAAAFCFLAICLIGFAGLLWHVT
jgi:hypothetical protein